MDFYIGTIMPFPYNFVPRNWAACNGQLLPIASYTTLFSLIGTYYGGDGRTTFALPNLNGGNGQPQRIAIGQGTGPGLTPRTIGETVGADTVTLTEAQIPSHSHGFEIYTDGTGQTTQPVAGQTLISAGSNGFVDPLPSPTTFTPGAVAAAGGNQGHPNDQPTLQLDYCICLEGIYPIFN